MRRSPYSIQKRTDDEVFESVCTMLARKPCLRSELQRMTNGRAVQIDDSLEILQNLELVRTRSVRRSNNRISQVFELTDREYPQESYFRPTRQKRAKTTDETKELILRCLPAKNVYILAQRVGVHRTGQTFCQAWRELKKEGKVKLWRKYSPYTSELLSREWDRIES